MATKTYKTKDGATVRVTTNSDGSRTATVTNGGNSSIASGTTYSRSASGEVTTSSSPKNYNLTNQNNRYTDWNSVAQGMSPDIAYTEGANSSTGGANVGLTANKDWGIITDATGSYDTRGRGATLNSSVKGLSNTYNYSNSGINSNIYTPSQLVLNNKNGIALGGYQFGTAAELAEKNSPGYLSSRNSEIAQLLSSNGILDKEGIGQYLSQYDSFTNYDISGQQNTINNIYNEIIRQQGQGQQQQQEINLNSPFMATVDSILKNAYGIDSVDAIKDMYGAENYYNLMNALKDVEGTWNATDPASRSQLQGQLQEIIGAVVGTGVDQSKLNLNMEAVLSQFTPQARQQIEQDVLAVQNLQTKGYSVDQIAKQTGMSKDQVNQLVLLNQGLPSQIGKYYDLNSETEEFITEDYERARDNLMANYKWNMEQVNQQLTQIKEDFNKTYLDQQEANENTLHNMDLIAGMTGTGYSRRGLEGMSYAQQQANAVLNNLLDNYDRSNLEIANSIKSLTMAYQQSDAELVDQMNDAILNAKNNYITQVSNIQAKYGLVGLEGQQAIAQAVQGFVNQAETIYNNAFNRAWTNTNNLISAVSNIGALEQQQMQTKQMKIAEFQQDSMYMTQSQIADYAQKNGLQMSYDQLVGYQQDATINTLNSISPGLGNQYAQQISKMLANGYTPQQAVSQILNSDELQGSGWQVQGNYFVNPSTQQAISFEQAASGMYGTNGATGMGGYNTQAIQQEIANYSTQWTGQYTEGQQINKQCGAFVNDYLESMGLGRVFTDPIEKKKAAMNRSKEEGPTVGSVVVMESPYEKTKQYGHVAIVTGINGDGTMNVARANTNGDKAYHTGKININSKSILGYYDPAKAMAEQSGYTTQQQNTQARDPTLSSYYENWFKITKDDRANTLKEYGLTQQQFNTQRNAYFDNLEKTEAVKNITELRDMAQQLLDWNRENSSKGWGSLHEGLIDARYDKDGNLKTQFLGQTLKTNEGYYMFKFLKDNQTLDKFLDAKKNGATFGAMSNAEWQIIGNAASNLQWNMNDKTFEKNLQDMIDKYDQALAKIQGGGGGIMQ